MITRMVHCCDLLVELFLSLQPREERSEKLEQLAWIQWNETGQLVVEQLLQESLQLLEEQRQCHQLELGELEIPQQLEQVQMLQEHQLEQEVE